MHSNSFWDTCKPKCNPSFCPTSWDNLCTEARGKEDVSFHLETWKGFLYFTWKQVIWKVTSKTLPQTTIHDKIHSAANCLQKSPKTLSILLHSCTNSTKVGQQSSEGVGSPEISHSFTLQSRFPVLHFHLYGKSLLWGLQYEKWWVVLHEYDCNKLVHFNTSKNKIGLEQVMILPLV